MPGKESSELPGPGELVAVVGPSRELDRAVRAWVPGQVLDLRDLSWVSGAARLLRRLRPDWSEAVYRAAAPTGRFVPFGASRRYRDLRGACALALAAGDGPGAVFVDTQSADDSSRQLAEAATAARAAGRGLVLAFPTEPRSLLRRRVTALPTEADLAAAGVRAVGLDDLPSGPPQRHSDDERADPDEVRVLVSEGLRPGVAGSIELAGGVLLVATLLRAESSELLPLRELLAYLVLWPLLTNLLFGWSSPAAALRVDGRGHKAWALAPRDVPARCGSLLKARRRVALGRSLPPLLLAGALLSTLEVRQLAHWTATQGPVTACFFGGLVLLPWWVATVADPDRRRDEGLISWAVVGAGLYAWAQASGPVTGRQWIAVAQTLPLGPLLLVAFTAVFLSKSGRRWAGRGVSPKDEAPEPRRRIRLISLFSLIVLGSLLFVLPQADWRDEPLRGLVGTEEGVVLTLGEGAEARRVAMSGIASAQDLEGDPTRLPWVRLDERRRWDHDADPFTPPRELPQLPSGLASNEPPGRQVWIPSPSRRRFLHPSSAGTVVAELAPDGTRWESARLVDDASLLPVMAWTSDETFVGVTGFVNPWVSLRRCGFQALECEALPTR